jgi:hypothetical protein
MTDRTQAPEAPDSLEATQDQSQVLRERRQQGH